jgi:hypothetical protein
MPNILNQFQNKGTMAEERKRGSKNVNNFSKDLSVLLRLKPKNLSYLTARRYAILVGCVSQRHSPMGNPLLSRALPSNMNTQIDSNVVRWPEEVAFSCESAIYLQLCMPIQLLNISRCISVSSIQCTVLKSISTFNTLKPNGNYMSHLLQQSVTLHFVFMDFA